jgi:putative ABC transport system permease protein
MDASARWTDPRPVVPGRAARGRCGWPPVPLRLALREMRGGLRGLKLLAVCLFLGVAALSGIGSLSRALGEGLLSDGRAILGGDVELRLTQRRATPDEWRAFTREGRVSEQIEMRAMTGRPGSGMRVLVELAGVDGAYPLYGTVELSGTRPGVTLQQLLAEGKAAVDQSLLDRIEGRVGDRLELGTREVTIGAVIATLPDRAGSGLAWGPTVLVSRDVIEASGLVQPGSLVRYHYRIRTPEGTDAQAAVERLQAGFPEEDWRERTHENSAPGVRRFVGSMGQFLTLVGLTSLIVAGVGVANGVGFYLESKSGAIAALKALGATSGQVAASYLLQIGLVAALSITAGAFAGALFPYVAVWLIGDALPVEPAVGVFPRTLVLAAGYGALIAAAFTVWPLVRARGTPAARLFRDVVEEQARPPVGVLALIAAPLLLVAAVAVWRSDQKLLAAGFVAAAAGLVGLLMLVARVLRWMALRAPRPRDPLLRLAVDGLTRPRAPAAQLIMALGLGLTLFAALAVVETNLAGQIQRTVPEKAPALVYLDVASADMPAFVETVGRAAPGAVIEAVPSLRGPITAVNGVPVREMKKVPDEAWILSGDRGLTYAAEVPQGNEVVEGEWWPADYTGPPLVSLAEEQARALELGPGDRITVSVLGVEVEATIANLRKVDWDSLGFNFALIFAPGTLEEAPHNFMASVALPPEEEAPLLRATARAFPAATVLRIKDLLATAGDMLAQVSVAVRTAASVTIAAGIAVLVGALAAQRRARVYDAVVMKMLGADRRQLLGALVIEHGAIALVLAVLALVLGGAAGWYVVVHVLELEWQPRWFPVIATVVAGGAITIGLSLAGSWAALSARPARVLRSL